MRPATVLLLFGACSSVTGLSTLPRAGSSLLPVRVHHARSVAPIIATATQETPPLPEPDVRPPYLLTNLSRPQWRGRMMGWLHATKAWYVLSLAYVLLAWAIPSAKPLNTLGIAIRAVAAAASSANVLISDGYHNADRRGAAACTAERELFWLRWDYIGISSVLTSLLWLWSYNFGWALRLRAVGIAGGVSTVLVALLSRFLVPRKIGHTAVKLTFAVQYVGLLGYLVTVALPSACRLTSLIFVVYAPGMILYVLKKPKNEVFGFHELFHTSVLAGHLTSMMLDLRDIAAPCARCLCCL